METKPIKRKCLVCNKTLRRGQVFYCCPSHKQKAYRARIKVMVELARQDAAISSQAQAVTNGN